MDRRPWLLSIQAECRLYIGTMHQATNAMVLVGLLESRWSRFLGGSHPGARPSRRRPRRVPRSFRCFKAEQRAVVDEAREPEKMGKSRMLFQEFGRN